MDNLTMALKEVPIYTKNLYKWIPEPAMLKQNIHWDIPVLKSLDCPYCSKSGITFYEDDDIFIYINPEGYLVIFTNEGIRNIEIQFCPVCGRQLR